MRASLSQKGVDLDERDFFKDGFSEQELRELLGGLAPSDTSVAVTYFGERAIH